MTRLTKSIKKTAKQLYNMLPVLLGVILLVSLANTLIPKEAYAKVFSKNAIIDSVIGSALGSILAGNPITSYILGGEMLNQGVSLIAVTAFLVAWVTVGIVQFPAEAMILGKRFAIIRNASAFLLAIIVSIATVAILGTL